MKKLTIAFAMAAACFALPSVCHAQSALVSPIVKALAGRGAGELAKAGGEQGVKAAAKKIAAECGEQGVKEAGEYAAKFGAKSLSAISHSPKTVLPALKRCPDNLKGRLISIAEEGGGKAARELGENGLLIEAKFPSLGKKIVSLGDDVAKTAADKLGKQEINILAKNARALDAAKRADPAAFKSFSERLSKLPADTIRLLEKNPKVLFAGTALTAFICAKEETMNIVEKVLSKPLEATAWGGGTILLAWLFLKLSLSRFFRKPQETK
ncbi:MAG: hypothetical protein IJI37_01225 [Opitutales bacterium]|nr:hypothetical protein [Opitutales bacterium]